MKLVTSRGHRCYSALGSTRSARNERLNDLVHAVAVSLLLCSAALELAPLAARVKVDRHALAVAGSAVLALSQLVDLNAASAAHRMFYSGARHSSKRRSFVDDVTRIDTLVAALCLSGALCALMGAKLSGSARARDGMLSEHAAAAAAVLLASGAFANAVLGLPALVARVPASLARAHNAVVILFVTGAFGNVIVAIVHLAHGNRIDAARSVLATGAVASYALIWLGAVLNFRRTGALLARPRRAESEDTNVGKPRNGGLFSWFKTSKSDTAIDSDYDSDDIDEEEGFSSEDEGYSRRKSRK